MFAVSLISGMSAGSEFCCCTVLCTSRRAGTCQTRHYKYWFASISHRQLVDCCLGSDVVIIKNGERICGCGAALANAPLVQNKSYFEIKLQQAGLSDIHLVLPNLFKCSDGTLCNEIYLNRLIVQIFQSNLHNMWGVE